MKRILFVDDEPNVLSGLRRMLFELSDEWDMDFAEGADAALQLMAQKEFDVIVSDMRMPGKDGAALLTEVKQLYPHTIRFILTGHTDDDTAFRALDIAHQFMSKPCSCEQIKEQITRALSLRTLLDSKSLNEFVASLDSLPSLPDLYNELIAELNSENPSIRAVGEIIGRDVAMCAKLLHLVNSAFFGLRSQITDIAQAVGYLGLSTMKSLVILNSAFSQAANARLPRSFSLDAFAHRAMQVGTCARAICTMESKGKSAEEESFAAGVFHDLGQLVLAVNLPGDYDKTLTTAESHDGQKSLTAKEKTEFGASHAEIGAYLLGLWGISDPIVEAVAYHHSPGESASVSFDAVAAVHIACGIVEQLTGSAADGEFEFIDGTYLDRLDIGARVPVWRERCRTIVEGSANAE